MTTKNQIQRTYKIANVSHPQNTKHVNNHKGAKAWRFPCPSRIALKTLKKMLKNAQKSPSRHKMAKLAKKHYEHKSINGWIIENYRKWVKSYSKVPKKGSYLVKFAM